MRRAAIVLAELVAVCSSALALNPGLDISQYGHDAWTVRSGLIKGNIYGIAQTPDGYLWLGGEFGLFRFDGARTTAWRPPAGQRLPDNNISTLLVTRDGALWIGTFAGLATWSGGKLTPRRELGREFVKSLLEDSNGTVWVGTQVTSAGRLCAIRSRSAQCYGGDGVFGSFVLALAEDSSGALWAAAESGLWRWKPGPRRRYQIPPMQPTALTTNDEGRLLIARYGAEVLQFGGDRVESYPIQDPLNPHRLLRGPDVNSNMLLRDRDGGLWIGTVERGLIHVHHGRTDVFSRSDGLSGDVILRLFEDREGNVWVTSTGGLDRFRELPITTISVKQGLSSDATGSVLAAADGSIWIGTHGGLTNWKNGQATVFRKANGLPDDFVECLFRDYLGRIWVSTAKGLTNFSDGRFVAANSSTGTEVHSIAEDERDTLWLSAREGLLHFTHGRLTGHFQWSEFARHEQPSVLVADRGGVWLSFWTDGGVLYFKDGRVRASYSSANGLGAGRVSNIQLDRDGALWAATEGGGLSRINKDGRIATLTTRNGLPCDTIHWTIEDDDHSFWLYTGCGLVRTARSELDAWVADPKRRVATTVWEAAEGVRLRSVSPAYFGPPVAKSSDGKLWFVAGEGVQVVDPRHLVVNKLPPAVRIEQIVADHKIFWQNLTGTAVSNVRLPPRVRDLAIDYTALTLVAPEKVHFRFKLEGQDSDWREVVNDRQVEYSNLSPGPYRFRVIACNNSGLWNEQGDTLNFSIDAAYYQTSWFRALCTAVFLALMWVAYRWRVGQLARDFNLRVEARVNERSRIARELHDTLVQSFQASLVQMQIARTLVSRKLAQAVEPLEQAISMTERAIAEGREAIRELRSESPVPTDLAKWLTLMGREMASTQNPEGKRLAEFRATVEGEQRKMKPLIQDEAYRIGRELLRNAFQHAEASEIEAAIRYEERLFRLRVRDDGKGIDPKVLTAGGRAGHWGLTGMRERAKQIGGQLEIWSQAGAGTEVELSIPGAIAYESARDGHRRFALFHRKRAQT